MPRSFLFRPVISALFAVLFGAALMTPLTLTTGALQWVPGVPQWLCPETGRLSPPRFIPTSMRPRPYDVCLDEAGRPLEDKPLNDLMVQSLWLFWSVLLWPLAYGLVGAVQKADWSAAPRRSRARRPAGR